MAAMIFVAAGAAPLATPGDYTLSQLVGLVVAYILYILWNLVGTQGIVRLVLWEQADPPSMALRRPKCGPLLYFVVQLGLATFIYVTSDHGRIPSLMWLALLPPVAFSVFILEWGGIVTVSTLVMAILILYFHHLHGWLVAGYAGLSFSFAVLFTIVFSMLAVQSEKARNQVQRLAAELSSANQRLREYAVQAEELSATRERNRIAREVHDSLGHFLTVANVQLEAARVLWSTDPARAQESVLKAQSFIQEGLLDVRRSVASLRNSPLNNKSLPQALAELAAAAGSEKPAATFTVLGSARNLAPPIELSLYRAAQEGLTNARKHANATSVQVVLDFQQKDCVLLRVQDNGMGASQTFGPGVFGLRGLRERAQLLGGAVEIESAPNAGFTLNFHVPA